QLEGTVRCDDMFLQLYSSDASIYEIKPLGIIRPASVEDVVFCVRYAEENQIPIIPRGAGSNVAGACVGRGLILDFSYSMRKVEAVGRDSVTVQPGVVVGDINRQLKSHGQMFGPDPATRNVTTIGGTLSMNNTGSHWVSYGAPRDQVLKLQVVVSGGEVVEFDSCQNIAATDAQPLLRAQLYAGKIKRILTRNQELIDQHRPKTLQNQAGYNVFDLQQDKQIDLTRLFVGSEGTLGIITEATLRTIPIPKHRGVCLLYFYRLEDAAKAAVDIGKMGVSACDLIDRRLMSLARETRIEFQRLIPNDAEAMLLVEFQASDHLSLQLKLDQMVQRIHRRKKLAFNFRHTTRQEQRDLYWRIIRRIVPSLYRLRGDLRAIPFVEDIAIPPEKLPLFLNEIHSILNQNEVTASVLAHTPQGTIHIRPFMSLSNKEEVSRMQRLASQLFEKVIEFDGSVSGAHGDGLSRTWFLRRQYGKLYNVFGEVKQVFDPTAIFNPGKIVGHPFYGLGDNIRPVNVAYSAKSELTSTDTSTSGGDTRSSGNFWRQSETESRLGNLAGTIADIHPESAVATAPASPATLNIIEPELNWDIENMAVAARNCNGCGRCRSGNPNERTCPVFRIAPREEASPRAKANLIRGIITGVLDPKVISQDEFKDIADLCVNCHQCRFECPASVDIPKLMVETKAQYYATNGMKLSDWILTRLDWMYELAGRFPSTTNRMLKSRFWRWVLDRLVGISQGRKLPLFSKTTFARWAARKKMNRPLRKQSRRVVYFVDAFANWNDIELAQSFVKVLAHNGIDVVVPPSQSISGMSLICEGVVNRAKRLALRNVEMLAEWVRQGYQVVCTEPSAALAIRHEYLNLIEEKDAKLVAENTTDAMTYLSHLHSSGDLELDFKPLNATLGYHLPCHQRALGSEVPAVKLLNLVPGLKVTMIEKGCSGMAGTFGIKRKNYLKSLKMGFPLINAMRETDIIAGATECSTCKMQMEQGTTKPTIHPVKILAKAYGLMPELDDLFHRRSGDVFIS
ncbi:MAG: anaerobic glycerol-3-phosphate dehydrogenase subunit C, partial [Planctomycetota bacterium]